MRDVTVKVDEQIIVQLSQVISISDETDSIFIILPTYSLVNVRRHA
jgi:hypothetical protein